MEIDFYSGNTIYIIDTSALIVMSGILKIILYLKLFGMRLKI